MLSRAVKRVLKGTRTVTEAIVAEPSLNSNDATERPSYYRKVKRCVTKLEEQAAVAITAGTTAAIMVAAQKTAATAAAAVQKSLNAHPMATFEEGTRKSRKTASKVLSNKAAHKRRKTGSMGTRGHLSEGGAGRVGYMDLT